jgi:hypothetical protein
MLVIGPDNPCFLGSRSPDNSRPLWLAFHISTPCCFPFTTAPALAADDSHHRAAAAVLAPGVSTSHPPLPNPGDPSVSPPPPLAIPVPRAQPLLRFHLRHLFETEAAPVAEADLHAGAVGETSVSPRILPPRRGGRRRGRRMGRLRVAAVRVGPVDVRRPPDMRADSRRGS